MSIYSVITPQDWTYIDVYLSSDGTYLSEDPQDHEISLVSIGPSESYILNYRW